MGKFVLRRILLMIPTLFAISIISFIIIQAPPGDFLSFYITNLMQEGERVDESELESVKLRYGLGEPMHIQYLKWIWGVLRGNLGRSLQWNKPVSQLVLERLPASITISLLSLLVF